MGNEKIIEVEPKALEDLIDQKSPFAGGCPMPILTQWYNKLTKEADLVAVAWDYDSAVGIFEMDNVPIKLLLCVNVPNCKYVTNAEEAKKFFNTQDK
jgi:hypothetical protein